MAHRNSTDTYRGNFNDDNDEIVVVVLLTNSGGIVGGRVRGIGSAVAVSDYDRESRIYRLRGSYRRPFAVLFRFRFPVFLLLSLSLSLSLFLLFFLFHIPLPVLSFLSSLSLSLSLSFYLIISFNVVDVYPGDWNSSGVSTTRGSLSR